ncbi:MAG: hypothetical protein ABR520_11105 [Mycobacteriales bacterium]
MENILNPGRAPTLAVTTLELLTRGGVVSLAYLDVERTLDAARRVLDRDDRVRRAPIAALRALASRLGAHAEQLFRDHVREVPTRLPAGLTIRLPMWDSDSARLTSLLLVTYRQRCEGRIAIAVAARAALRATLAAQPDFVPAKVA